MKPGDTAFAETSLWFHYDQSRKLSCARVGNRTYQFDPAIPISTVLLLSGWDYNTRINVRSSGSDPGCNVLLRRVILN